jgi:UDP-glucose 4-epimerase
VGPMETNRILITGGSGDLGGRLMPLLQSVGYSTTNLDLHPARGDSCRSVTGSILDRTLVSELVAESDLIIHIAAWHGYHAFTRAKTPHEFWDLNMTGTFNLLEAASQHRVANFIFISSTSIDDWPEIYGTTKLLGEKLCGSYSERCGMKTLCLRPRAFIPWQNTSVYSSFEEWAAWFMRGAVHIDDVAQAVLRGCQTLCNTSSPLFEVVEIDGKRDLSDSDLLEWRSLGGRATLLKVFPEFKRQIARAPFIPDQPPQYRDSRTARHLLGYTARYGLRELLVEYASLTERDATLLGSAL